MSNPPKKNHMIAVLEVDGEPVNWMLTTAVSTVKSILGRLEVGYEHGLPKEVYTTALNDAFLEDKELAILMIPDYIIDSLMELWENEEIFYDEEQQNYLEYLKIFGFAKYRPGNAKKGLEPAILVNRDRKEDYYFFLRSRTSREKMDRYSRWEKIITGLMYYYGFLEMRELYEQFLRASREIVPYELFLSFIKCRCSLWAFGEILKDIHRNKDYFSWSEVNNRETLLLYIREHSDIPYKKVDCDDLIYISDGAGIDNRWPGISEMGSLLVNDLGMDYYQTTLHIRAMLRIIHNGGTLHHLSDRGNLLPLKTQAQKDAYEKNIRMLYDHVPVFEYKGYSHSEYLKLFYEKQLKKKTSLFTIIEGGE